MMHNILYTQQVISFTKHTVIGSRLMLCGRSVQRRQVILVQWVIFWLKVQT